MSLAERLRDLKPEPARILVLDIETAPGTAYIWGLRDQNIGLNQVIEHPRVLCFAAQWLGDKRMMFHSEREGREQMIAAAWDLLDEADVVVTYNGPRFDIPHLQREMVELGYSPPSPWIDVDLLAEVRRNFRFLSNKLGAVLERLGLDAKDDPGGFATWKGVMEGDDKAWRRMEKYNRIDVAVTASLYLWLADGWLRLPHAGLFSGDMRSCYACGSRSLTPDGIVRTKANAYLRLACECGAYNRLMVDGTTRRA